MKRKILISMIIVTTVLMACGKDDNTDTTPKDKSLTVEGSKFSVKIGEERTISITSGNGGYEVSSDNEGIATASVNAKGVITITPKSEGQAFITVGDKLGKEAYFSVVSEKPYFIWTVSSVVADVQVNNYELYKPIQEELLEDKILEAGNIVEFRAGQGREVVLYESHDKMRKGEPASQGTYSLDNITIRLDLGNRSQTFTVFNTYAGSMLKYMEDYFAKTKSEMPELQTTRLNMHQAMEMGNDRTDIFSERYAYGGVKRAALTYKILPNVYKNLN